MKDFYVFDDFLPAGLYETMKTNIPHVYDVPDRSRGLRDIWYSTPTSEALLGRPGWRTYLQAYVLSGAFWDERIYDFFWEEYNVAEHPLKLPFIQAAFPEKTCCFSYGDEHLYLYPRVDLSYGAVGYGSGKASAIKAEPHVDNPQRLITCILYFTDQSTQKGGRLRLHEPNGGPVREEIDIAENRMVVFQNHPQSWHSVEPVRAQSELRMSSMLQLSASQKFWLDRKWFGDEDFSLYT